MVNKLIKFYEIINESHISDTEKMLWRSFILHSSKEDLEILIQEIENNPSLIKYFTENLVRKIDILKKRNCVGMDKIISEEKEFLKIIN